MFKIFFCDVSNYGSNAAYSPSFSVFFYLCSSLLPIENSWLLCASTGRNETVSSKWHDRPYQLSSIIHEDARHAQVTSVP